MEIAGTPAAAAAIAVAELKSSWSTVPFLGTVFRHVIPVIGVIGFGWSALWLALYCIIESWLMLSLYATVDLSFNPKYGGRAPRTLREAVVQPLPQLAGAALVVAIPVGLFGALLLLNFFGRDEIAGLAAEGWRDPSLVTGLAILVVSCLVETVAFGRRLERRTPAQIVADDLRIASLFYRLVLLFMASGVLALAAGSRSAAALFVIALGFVLVVLEGMPRTAGCLLGIEAKSRMP